MAFSSPRPTPELRESLHSPVFRNELVARGVIDPTHRVPDDKAAVFDLEHQIPHLPQYADGLEVLGRLVPGGRLLDVGCSSGLFVHLASLAGFEAVGIDTQREAVEQGRSRFGVPLAVGSLDAGFARESSLDAITLWDVLEHVPDPYDLLETCRTLLRPGGVLLVKSPNNTVRLAMLRIGARRPKRGEYPMIAFEHIQHFTPRSLRRSLGRAGFENVAVIPTPISGLHAGVGAVARGLVDRALLRASKRRASLVHPMLLVARVPDPA